MKPFLLLALLPSLTLSKPVAPKHQGNGTWTPLTPLLSPRQEHTTLSLPSLSSVAVLGGIVITNDSSNPFATTNLFELYSIPNKAWTTLAPLPVPINHPNAAVVNNKVYLLGGLEVADNGAWVATNRSWVYDAAENEWTEIEPMPSARGSAAIGVYRSKIILAGGMTILEAWQGGRQDSVDDVTIFDTVTSTWIVGPTLPGRRDHAGGAVVGGKMYVIGGRDGGPAGVKGDVFELDMQKMEGWVTKSQMITPRGGLSAAVVVRRVYTFGGEGNPEEGTEGVFDQTEVYDTKKDEWKALVEMEVPRHGTSAVGVGGKIYIPGGGVSIGGAPVDHFDVFEPGC